MHLEMFIIIISIKYHYEVHILKYRHGYIDIIKGNKNRNGKGIC